jgi:hypothetical protein
MKSLQYELFPKLPLALLVVFFCGIQSGFAQARVLDAGRHHLGVVGRPEWRWFEGATPASNRLDIRFSAKANDREATLFIRQRDVKLDWVVELNGRKLGSLFLVEEPVVHTLPVPRGFLIEGTNLLSVLPPKQSDDIIVSEIVLETRPVEEVLSKTRLEVQVTDKKSGMALPCRITIVNERGEWAAIQSLTGQAVAVRPGVVYAAEGRAQLGLRPGKCTIHANRGFEYGMDQRTVTLSEGGSKTVRLQIAREVPTPGWVACDTHIHTFTHARHGDATIDERMLTLAGEGIEMPISTEHNVLIDFSEAARRMNVEKFFTPVIGCEVTTAFGHFNAFPMKAGSAPPDHRLHDWPRLMDSIRATPNVRVVILNHPRDVHTGFRPFAPTNFNSLSGENLRGPDFAFDAMEAINSGAMQSDWMLPFRDWFALLNHGLRVTAVASSDSHDVSRFIVGQGRTYVGAGDADTGHIDVSEASENIRRGRALVSLGLLTKLTVNGNFGVGDLATGLGKTMNVEVEVLAPPWIEADKVELFANGTKVRDSRLARAKKRNGRANRWTLSWKIPRPAQDVHLAAIASGPGVTELYWPIARPYQPSSLDWEPRVIGATNPVWIDADGDGNFSSARDYATELLSRFGPDARTLLPELEEYDEAVSVQAASLCQAAGRDVRGPEFVRALQASSDSVRRAFMAYSATLPTEGASK